MEMYPTLFINSALLTGNVTGPLSLLFLFFARFLPIIALSPFLGARVMPHPVKVVFAICMFVIFLPKLLTVTTTTLDFNPLLLTLFAKELFIGLLIGTIMSMPFNIVQNAGIFIDHQRGGASLMVNDPTVQNQSSPLGTLFNMTLIYIFFIIEGPFLFIEAVLTSYEVVPPDKFFPHQFFNPESSAHRLTIELLNQVMKMSIQLAMPGLLAILMTDMFLGIANRLAPQVQITFLGMPLKSLLGLTVVCLGWKIFAGVMVNESYYWLNVTKYLITLFNPNQTLMPTQEQVEVPEGL